MKKNGGGGYNSGVLAGSFADLSGPVAAQRMLPFFGLPASTPFTAGSLSGATSPSVFAGGPLTTIPAGSLSGDDAMRQIVELLMQGQQR